MMAALHLLTIQTDVLMSLTNLTTESLLMDLVERRYSMETGQSVTCYIPFLTTTFAEIGMVSMTMKLGCGHTPGQLAQGPVTQTPWSMKTLTHIWQTNLTGTIKVTSQT
jgi:hypothetical protein